MRWEEVIDSNNYVLFLVLTFQNPNLAIKYRHPVRRIYGPQSHLNFIGLPQTPWFVPLPQDDHPICGESVAFWRYLLWLTQGEVRVEEGHSIFWYEMVFPDRVKHSYAWCPAHLLLRLKKKRVWSESVPKINTQLLRFFSNIPLGTFFIQQLESSILKCQQFFLAALCSHSIEIFRNRISTCIIHYI